MTTRRAGAVVRCLRGADGPAHPAGEADGELLERFVRRRDEAALEALVRRHAPMVWGVCRRILRNHHDAEDALQATFIVLVRRAASVAPRETVANWLYGVARQTALKARQVAAKRNRRERQVTEMPQPTAPEADRLSDLDALLDEQLAALPEKYRVLVVLCDLEGRTRREAAAQLGLPEGTVAGRLARARAMLAARLTRRGLAVSSALLPSVLATEASAGVPASAVLAAVQTAIRGAQGVTTGSSALLAEGVMKAMLLTKLKVATGILIALAAVGAALWIPTPSSRAADEPPKKRMGDTLPGTSDLRPGEPDRTADLSGRWEGEDWGRVELKAVKPGTYEGTYTDTFGPGPGTITLAWSADDRRYTGTWAEGKDRFGTISVRADGREIRGAFATDPACRLRPGKPALADLRWVRSPEPLAGGPNPARGDAAPGGEVLAWGKAENGLRMGLSVAGPHRLAVVIENVGKDDAVVNLGIMLANGKRQFPTAIKLHLTDPDGKTRACEWPPPPGIAGRVDPFVVPLPAGGQYTLALPLDTYAAQLRPLAQGRYRVAAEFTGEKVTRTNADSRGLALMPYWTGTLRSGEVTLDLPVKMAKARATEPVGALGKVGEFLWGKEVKGLQAGIALRGDRKTYRIGEEVFLEVRVRNVSQAPVMISYSSARLLHTMPEVKDANGRRVTGVGDNRLVMPPAVRYIIPVVEGVLKPGEEMTFDLVQLKLAPATAEGLVKTPELRAAPGVYSISYTVPLGTDLLPATGPLKLIVQPAEGGE
jgi:RNA polymerase sigma factor (sigma-70 family)